MAYFDDLSVCTYFPVPTDVQNPLVAVGWLERDHSFPTGPISKEFFEKLVDLCIEPYEPWLCRGWHTSSLRQFPHAIETFRYKNVQIEGLYVRNLFVPDGQRIFVAPVAILQYIDRYWYQPPEVFTAAVKKCPSPRSLEYKKLFLESGGRALLRDTENGKV